jgi:hypothetical protein
MLPEDLRPDRGRYPNATGAEWRCAQAVIEEGCRRVGWGRLTVLMSRLLPPERPWLVAVNVPGGTDLSTDLDRLPDCHRVTVTPQVYKIVLDVAQAAQQHEYPRWEDK